MSYGRFDYFIGRLFVRVREAHNLPVYTRPHLPLGMRYACLTHRAVHVMDQTLEGYLHLAAPNAMRAVVRSLLKIYDIMPTR
jgi:hypothetical protein